MFYGEVDNLNDKYDDDSAKNMHRLSVFDVLNKDMFPDCGYLCFPKTLYLIPIRIRPTAARPHIHIEHINAIILD